MTDQQFAALTSSATDNWETPQWLFDKYDAVYHFTLDAASSDENAKVANHYTARDNGLLQKWGGWYGLIHRMEDRLVSGLRKPTKRAKTERRSCVFSRPGPIQLGSMITVPKARLSLSGAGSASVVAKATLRFRQ